MYKNLENVRKKNLLTINDMAKVISKSPANYYKKETGVVVFTIKEAILIAKYLKQDIMFLFDEV